MFAIKTDLSQSKGRSDTSNKTADSDKQLQMEKKLHIASRNFNVQRDPRLEFSENLEERLTQAKIFILTFDHLLA